MRGDTYIHTYIDYSIYCMYVQLVDYVCTCSRSSSVLVPGSAGARGGS